MFEFAGFSVDLGMIIRIILTLVIGIPLIRMLSNMATKVCEARVTPHLCVLINNLIFYAGLGFIGINILNELGFSLTALLGAAGVVGVAVGFASQTSISNIISGIFLLLERPFSIGDFIKCGDISGVVKSIDLLSVKVRTFDNNMVRVPNETLIKQRVTNVTFYPMRRVDLVVSVDREHNIDQVKKIIEDVIKANKKCLKEPAPAVVMRELTPIEFTNQIRVAIRVRVWAKKKDAFALHNELVPALKEKFDSQKIAFVLSHAN